MLIKRIFLTYQNTGLPHTSFIRKKKKKIRTQNKHIERSRVERDFNKRVQIWERFKGFLWWGDTHGFFCEHGRHYGVGFDKDTHTSSSLCHAAWRTCLDKTLLGSSKIIGLKKRNFLMISSCFYSER